MKRTPRRPREPDRLRSVQTTILSPRPGGFERWSQPPALHALLHRYFDVAEQITGHLVRVRWIAGAPAVLVPCPRVRLIVMGVPMVSRDEQRCAIVVPIVGGMIVEAAGVARLSIELARAGDGVRASVALVDYCPRTGRLVAALYRSLQAPLHQYVGRRFLRQLRPSWDAGLLEPASPHR